MTEYDIISVEDAIEKLRAGERSRHYAITAMNHHSSRSHTIFRIKVQSIQKEAGMLDSSNANKSVDIMTDDTTNSIITESVIVS